MGDRWGGLITACGVVLVGHGGPMVLIFGLLMMITAALEPIYGRGERRPLGATWQPRDERFVNPETGELVTVWYNPQCGERRYVEDKAGS